MNNHLYSRINCLLIELSMLWIQFFVCNIINIAKIHVYTYILLEFCKLSVINSHIIFLQLKKISNNQIKIGNIK